jgi:hypothetical protein
MIGQIDRCFHVDLAQQIPQPTTAYRPNSFAAQAEYFAGLSFAGDF